VNAELMPLCRMVEPRSVRHERTLVPDAAGTRIVDHLTVEPRLALTQPVTKWMVGHIFDHRHRRLNSLFALTR
jgi:hypothetical protein